MKKPILCRIVILVLLFAMVVSFAACEPKPESEPANTQETPKTDSPDAPSKPDAETQDETDETGDNEADWQDNWNDFPG